jgi:hypothetical protein
VDHCHRDVFSEGSAAPDFHDSAHMGWLCRPAGPKKVGRVDVSCHLSSMIITATRSLAYPWGMYYARVRVQVNTVVYVLSFQQALSASLNPQGPQAHNIIKRSTSQNQRTSRYPAAFVSSTCIMPVPVRVRCRKKHRTNRRLKGNSSARAPMLSSQQAVRIP